ncbi:MAG: hypothetical protein FWD69_04875 [Polyangiaceae bacterium]|nr:hypothetical protein [Polyangiaceae bacterium]
MAGCTHAEVVRVYDGRIVRDAYVPAEAYALYLRGVLAEASGELDSALSAFSLAARQDDGDVEIWTRIGEVRCLRDARDTEADRAFDKARRIDPAYAGTLAAKARCAERRGNMHPARTYAMQATARDPGNANLDALLLRIDARRADASGRERAIALTLEHGNSDVAWSALGDWGRSRNDAYLVARGLEGLVTTAPTRSLEVESGALTLLGAGHLVLAREVSATLADASRELGVRGPRDPTVARLAVDEALARGDLPTASARATRGRVSLAEVAARALLLGERAAALSIAQTVARADPGASAAHMILDALASADSVSVHPRLARVTDRPPQVCVLVFADRLARLAGAEIARSWLERVRWTPMAAHDSLTGSLLVDLAARGVVAAEDLPLELGIELSARRREVPSIAPAAGVLDAKHELLLAVLKDPSGADAQAKLARLANAADVDPIVAYSLSLVAMANPRGRDTALRMRDALRVAPADPLILALAVDFAQYNHRPREIALAKTQLMAVAETPAERALASPHSDADHALY